MPSRIPFEKGSILGYAVAALLLLTAGLLSYQSLARLLNNEAWVDHTHLVLLRLENVFSALKDAESAKRGYLLTGDAGFLTPLRAARPQILADQRALDGLTADNPAQQRRLDTLRTLIAIRYELIQTNLTDYQSGRGINVAHLRQGKADMDKVRGLIGRLQTAEYDLLAQRRARMRQSASITPPLIMGLTGLALLVAGLASWRLHRSRTAERRANREISNREAILHAILNASPDGISLYEQVRASRATQPEDFRLRLLNPAAEITSGHTDADLGRSMSEMHPNSVASGRLLHYQRVIATGELWESEIFVEARQRWYRLVAARAGQYLLLSSTDVTIRKQHERAALDYQQRKYEAVFNQTDQVMCLLDAQGRFLDVNRTVLRMGGGTAPDYLGRYWGDSPVWTLPGVAAQLKHAIERAAQGENVREDFSLRQAENQVSYTDVSLTPVRGEDGAILFLLAEGRDITERVRAEQALQASHAALRTLSQTLEQRVLERTARLEESRARFAQLLETIPNMAWTAHPNGRLNYYNQQWYDYTGVTKPSLESQGWQGQIHPDDLAPTTAAWQQAVQSGQPLAELRNRWKRAADGEYRWHLVRAVPLRDEAGTIILWVGSNTDIHAQQLQQQELERVNADLDTFVYTASHDLRTPISNIESLLVELREELDLPPAEADVAPLLDMVQSSVDRFKRTIAHLTEVSQLQKNQQSQPVADVDLAALVADVWQDLRPLFHTTGGQLTIHIAPGQTLAFAEKNLRSIVLNLLSNALKYHHPARPPQVRLHCYPAGHYTVLEVQDNGLGLTTGQQARLFGLFQRLHDHVEGSGVGLYMVKKIIDTAGGRIEVESQPEGGSIFRVYFPR